MKIGFCCSNVFHVFPTAFLPQDVTGTDAAQGAPFCQFIDCPRHAGTGRRDLLHEALL